MLLEKHGDCLVEVFVRYFSFYVMEEEVGSFYSCLVIFSFEG